MQTLTGFELYLITGGNPANQIPALCRITAALPDPERGPLALPAAIGRPWAVIFLNRYHTADGWQPGIEATRLDGSISVLGRWAVIESLNIGSFQRGNLPPEIAAALTGSGRWCANDNGGWFGFLRDAALQWLRLKSGSPGNPGQFDFNEAARLLNIPRAVLGVLAPAAEKIRQGRKHARVLDRLAERAARGDRGPLYPDEADAYAALPPNQTDGYNDRTAPGVIRCDGADGICEKHFPDCGRCPAQKFMIED